MLLHSLNYIAVECILRNSHFEHLQQKEEKQPNVDWPRNFPLLSSMSETLWPPKRCQEMPSQPTISMSQVQTWSDLKDLVENIPSHITEIILPSLQISKSIEDPPITLKSSLRISCVSGGVCIFQGSQAEDGGGGTFIIISGGLTVILQGLTFLNASTSAVVVAKKRRSDIDRTDDDRNVSGAISVDGEGTSISEQIFCGCHFFGYVMTEKHLLGSHFKRHEVLFERCRS